MEPQKLGALITAHKGTLTSLQQSSKSILIHEDGETRISVYSGELTAQGLIEQTKRILQAFPALPNSFADLLIERVKDKGFSDSRLRDAVNNVIDNCPYPTPTMANFLGFDKRVRVYNYNEICALITKFEASFDDYHRYPNNGKPFFVKKCDKEMFNLPDEL